MPVEDFNRRAVQGLERAQQASGLRSAEAFAGRLAQRAGGSPDGSTYRRWIRGESVIPAWALIAAADECELSPNDLLGWNGTTDASVEAVAFAGRLGQLEREILELRREFSRAMDHLGEEASASGDTLARIVRALEDANLWEARPSDTARDEAAGHG